MGTVIVVLQYGLRILVPWYYSTDPVVTPAPAVDIVG